MQGIELIYQTEYELLLLTEGRVKVVAMGNEFLPFVCQAHSQSANFYILLWKTFVRF